MAPDDAGGGGCAASPARLIGDVKGEDDHGSASSSRSERVPPFDGVAMKRSGCR
jgi:hypothetical protein